MSITNKCSSERRNDMLKSPDQIGEYMHVSAFNTLLVCLTVLLLVGAFFLWAFLGKVTDKVEYTGILVPAREATDITLPNDGVVRTLLVNNGERVKAGQPLALVSVNGQYSTVSSTCDGILVTVKTEEETFEALEPIFCIFADDGSGTVGPLLVMAWVDNETRRLLHEGMNSQVWPVGEKRDEIGYVVGHVSSVDMFPSTLREVQNKLYSKDLAESLMPQDDAAYTVVVGMEHAVDDPSILHWSFGEPDGIAMNVGTTCNILTEARSRTVMQYFFDQVKFKVNTVRQWME